MIFNYLQKPIVILQQLNYFCGKFKQQMKHGKFILYSSHCELTYSHSSAAPHL